MLAAEGRRQPRIKWEMKYVAARVKISWRNMVNWCNMIAKLVEIVVVVVVWV